MKASTALFASVVAICCTVSFVSGQVKFADGTEQTTAYSPRIIKSSDKFNFTVNFGLTGLPAEGMQLSDTVPAGQELVILQINSATNTGNYYSSRLPSPNELTNPIDIAKPHIDTYYSFDKQLTLDFPDGTVTIDEGRQLWGAYGQSGLKPCSVLGYYRDK